MKFLWLGTTFETLVRHRGGLPWAGFFRHVIFAKWVISKETTSNYRTVYTPPPPLQNIYPLIQTGNFLSTESVNIDQQHSLLLVNNITTLIFLQHTIIILLNFPHLLSCGIPKLFLLSCVLRKWRKWRKFNAYWSWTFQFLPCVWITCSSGNDC